MKVIILCGGMGTRLREETEYKPKPMVEIGGKPILWHIMKHYAHYGHKEFILALGYKGDYIRDYFLNFYNYNSDFSVDLANNGSVEIHNSKIHEDWKITLVETGDTSMTGFRTKLCEKHITEDRFMLTYGDAVSNVNINDLISFHMEQDTIGTVTGVYPPSRFGDLVTDNNSVVNFKQQIKETENKEPINGGYFVFKREFLDLIPNSPKADIEGIPMDKLVEKKQLSVYRHKNFWQCMDTFRDNQMLEKMWQENPIWKIWN
ncbi:MAG: glucose-1-phosphate cytidylyltransferase [Bacteroidales bacterium]|jgi:glucose-1-phosphate cytidylyltransferase|nr:glucose-1-phosphate cytidylyltransferase [Bacteroidales bacterium]